MKPLLQFALATTLAGLAFAAPATTRAATPAPHAPLAPHVVEVAITAPRLHVGDLLPAVSGDAAQIDLGPSPSPGGSRLVDRATLARAFDDQGIPAPKTLPEAVRVVRKMRRLDASAVEHEIRTAADMAGAMPRGATLAAVRAPVSVQVPDGWTRSRIEIPKPPRRTGAFATTATLVLLNGDDDLARVPVPVELTLGAAAAVPDVARGAPIVLVIERGLVEVKVTGTAAADADVGAMVPITLPISGRTVRARVVEPGRAVAEEAR